MNTNNCETSCNFRISREAILHMQHRIGTQKNISKTKHVGRAHCFSLYLYIPKTTFTPIATDAPPLKNPKAQTLHPRDNATKTHQRAAGRRPVASTTAACRQSNPNANAARRKLAIKSSERNKFRPLHLVSCNNPRMHALQWTKGDNNKSVH